MNLAHRILSSLGATQVFRIDVFKDPTTEEEFNLLEYESSTKITWQQYQEAYPIIELKFGLRLLRAHRDRLLAKCDWIMTVDSFQSLANKDEWLSYRQMLRDIPINPPPFKWKGVDIDAEQMFPTQPPILRITAV